MFTEKDLDRLHQGVLEIYPDSVWPTWRGGWPNRADLALLDAIYSTQQKYETAVLSKVIHWKSKYPAPPQPELEYLSTIKEGDIQNVLRKNVLPWVLIPRVGSGEHKSAGVKEVAQLLARFRTVPKLHLLQSQPGLFNRHFVRYLVQYV